MTCCVAKILERMVLNRWHPLADPRLHERQCGLRTGSDFPACSILETLNLRRHTRTYCVLFDMRKAFDVAWCDGAMLRLYCAGVHSGRWHLIDDFVNGYRPVVAIIRSMTGEPLVIAKCRAPNVFVVPHAGRFCTASVHAPCLTCIVNSG